MINNKFVEFRDKSKMSILGFSGLTSKIILNKQKGKFEMIKRTLRTIWIYCQNCKIYKAIQVHHIDGDNKIFI